jgi:hypothetical protein
MAADHQEDPCQGWNGKLRLAIDADNADEARAIAEEVWRKMEPEGMVSRNTPGASRRPTEITPS